LAYIPSDAVDAIYSVIEGATHVKTEDQESWYVPCLSQANLSFNLRSDICTVNPMVFTTPVIITDNRKQYALCLNSFRKQLNGKQADMDFFLRDIFMRNTRLLCL